MLRLALSASAGIEVGDRMAGLDREGRQQMQRLGWGLIGGGEGSQIGFVHRAGAEIDRLFELRAGAFDVEPARSIEFGTSLGLDPSRVYGTWQELLAAEAKRPDRLDLVTVATPNTTHYEIGRALLEAGFNVFCEKPLTTTLEDARRLESLAGEKGAICAVNFGYSGYPMVRHMRSLVHGGELGAIRLVKAEFAAGFLADSSIDDNPRVRWRFDPELAGNSFVMADMGSHAMHLVTFVTGQRVRSLSADLATGVKARGLEDDAYVAFRTSGGAIGRLWVSALAAGRTHGLTLQVFGERGGLSWKQEWPEQLRFTPVGEAPRILERGMDGLSGEAAAANRITVGHPEGMVLGFANLYRDIAAEILARRAGSGGDSGSVLYPDVSEGRHMVEVVCAAVESSRNAGSWQTLD